MKRDMEILRELAKEYAEFALSGHCVNMPQRYRKLNSLEIVRPPVLVFEEPWGEFGHYDELKLKCEEPSYQEMERQLRMILFKKKHFLGDFIVHPYIRSPISVVRDRLEFRSEEDVPDEMSVGGLTAHGYKDVLPDDEAVERVCVPGNVSIDEEETERLLAYNREVFDGILPVKKSGIDNRFATWDVISCLHGVETSLMDLVDRPEFMHRMVEKFTQIYERELDCYERLNVLDGDQYYLHCTPACTYDLPVKYMDTDKIGAKDVWGRGVAQILGAVSPEMLDEFDLRYQRRLADRCGLLYYGCCEPLDGKIGKLRQFKNLRRISITPWANVDKAAEEMGSDFVLSYKSNPAYVASGTLDTDAAKAETRKVLSACRKNGTPCEFILKDITTAKGNVGALADWVNLVNAQIDEYF